MIVKTIRKFKSLLTIVLIFFGTFMMAAPSFAGSDEMIHHDKAKSPLTDDVCQDAVQGKVAWDYNGNNRWAQSNLNRLCKDVERSPEPAICFQTVMHGGVNWGGGTAWMWENAMNLCEQSSSARGTIMCFQSAIEEGRHWREGIEECDERAGWKWEMTSIPVCWSNSLSSNNSKFKEENRKKKLVKDIVKAEWEKFSALSFTGWKDCKSGSDAGIQIKISHDGETNPSSVVGRRSYYWRQKGYYGDPTPGMTLQFNSSDAYIGSSALHEFGHALGFQHEHRKVDSRGNLVTDFACQAMHEPKDGDPEVENGIFLRASYDANSIMSYCPIFKTFFDSISEGDALGIQAHYGAGPKGEIFSVATRTGAVTCESKYPKSGRWNAAQLHVYDNSCIQCPLNYNRTVNPDYKAATACQHKNDFFKTKAARYVGKPGCGSGSFQNGLNNDCYSCPFNYERTLVPANNLSREQKACVRKDWGVGRMTTLPWRILSPVN